MSVIENIFFKREQFQIKIDRLELKEEGINLIFGPSGCGKSTLLNICCGVIETEVPFQWLHQGQDLAALSLEEKRMGVVFQQLALFENLTGEANIFFPIKSYKIPKAQAMETFQLVDEKLKISSFLKQKVSEMSGGQKQRIAIARSLIFRPKVALLDEPFQGLDEVLKKNCRQLLSTFCRDFKTTFLMVSHEKADRDFADHTLDFVDMVSSQN